MGRVTKLRNRPGWYLEWTDGFGRWQRRRSHGSRGDARKLLRELEQQADRERLGVGTASPATEISLEELAKSWRDYVLTYRRPATWERYEIGLREVLGWLSTRGNAIQYATDIHVEALSGFVAWKLQQGVAPRTVNIATGALRALFNWAVRNGHLRATPIPRWEPLRAQPRRRRRALTVWEIVKLLEHSPSELADIWRFVVGSGLRAGELTSLEWPDVDWQARTVRVRAETSKSKRDRTVPLRDDLIGVLQRQRQRGVQRKAVAQRWLSIARRRLSQATGVAEQDRIARQLQRAERALGLVERLVFTNTRGGHWGKGLSRRLGPCRVAAGLARDIDVHTLRHTFGSHLIAAGVDVKTVQDLLGHSSAVVTLDVYAHVFEQRKRDAVDLIPIPEPAVDPRGTRAAAVAR